MTTTNLANIEMAYAVFVAPRYLTIRNAVQTPTVAVDGAMDNSRWVARVTARARWLMEGVPSVMMSDSSVLAGTIHLANMEMAYAVFVAPRYLPIRDAVRTLIAAVDFAMARCHLTARVLAGIKLMMVESAPEFLVMELIKHA